MSGALTEAERQRLALALHAAVDGDYLVGAGMGVDNAGQDVGLGEVRTQEVVWWAVDSVSATVAAIADARMTAAVAAERERIGEFARQTCREEGEVERCGARAEFILWGKLLSPDALGPRCYDHAVKHLGHSMPSRPDQYAVLDLRPALRIARGES